MTLYDFLIIVVPVLTLAKSFIMLKPTAVNKKKRVNGCFDLFSEMMVLNDDGHMLPEKMEILLTLFCSFSIILFNMKKLLVIPFIIKIFVQINVFKKV